MPAEAVSGTPAAMREALKKATTEMLVLFLLRQKEMYTYEMMAEVERLSENELSFHTLYQAIYRLTKGGYIEETRKELSSANRMRVYFTVTRSGRAYYEGLLEQYRSYTRAIDRLLEKDGTLKMEEDENG